MPQLTVRRDPGGWRDRWRAYVITLNGAEVGRLRRGESLTCAFDADGMVALAQIDWCASDPVIVSGEADIELTCRARRSALFALRDMKRGPYIALERV